VSGVAPNANYLVFNGLNNAANGNSIIFTGGFGSGLGINNSNTNGNGNGGISAIEIVNTVPNAPLVMTNAVTVNANSTIDVTGWNSATMSGALTLGNSSGGAIQLTATGAGTGWAAATP